MRADLELPSIEEYNLLREAFIEIGYSEYSTVKQIPNDQNALYIGAEKLYIDTEFLVWPPVTLCINGIIRTQSWGSSLVVKYSQLAHNATTENSSVNHSYVFREEQGDLVEFGHSILACPKISSPTMDVDLLESDTMLDQIAEGERILRQNTGNQLEIASGDCGILFDRIAEFL